MIIIIIVIIDIVVVECLPACENGGRCLEPGFCVCQSGYSGDLCQNQGMRYRVRRKNPP